ncbi:MAG TPA: MJ0042-type zinc finger domain-containing protein, partial [Burkholderiales bacterium]|nr:MJ0042-type zinc finger domain-containing protein [Burkholderiales bacterium]
MSMITRCPSCHTAFRVTPRELQARGGQVRCGRCLTVFDGFSTLATLPEPPAAPAPAAPAFELEPVAAAPAGP